MKSWILLPILLWSSWSSAQEEINPFLSAEDRQAAIEEERQAENAKLKVLVEEAISELRQETSGVKSSDEMSISREGQVTSAGRSALLTPPSLEKKMPDDFVIAAIKGDHVLIRQMNNKSVLIKSGQTFWDQGEAFTVSLGDHNTVSVVRQEDQRKVFHGGVGAMFTPDGSSGGSQAENGSRGSMSSFSRAPSGGY